MQNCWIASNLTRIGGSDGYLFVDACVDTENSYQVNNIYYNTDLFKSDDNTITGLLTSDMQSPSFVNRLNQNLPEGAIAWAAVKGDYPTLWSGQGGDPNPDANAEIEKSFTLRAVPGGIVLHTDQAVKVEVYTFRGTLQTVQAVPAGSSTLALPEGLYIVKAGQQVEKVAVK